MDNLSFHNDDYEVVSSRKMGFWDSTAGMSLRWLGFIPVQLLYLLIVALLVNLLLMWWETWHMEAFWIFMVLGGAVFVTFPAFMLSWITKLVIGVTPHQKTGKVMITILMVILILSQIVTNFTNELYEWPIWRTIYWLLIVGSMFYGAWYDED